MERVELLLKHFPHSLHSNSFSALWIALNTRVGSGPGGLPLLPPPSPVLVQTDLVAEGFVAELAGEGPKDDHETKTKNFERFSSENICFGL